MKQKTNKLLFSLYYAHMTFLVIKDQISTSSSVVQTFTQGRMGRVESAMAHGQTAPLLPFLCNLVTRAFPVKKCVAPPIF